MQTPKYKISFFDNCYTNVANEKELSFDEILDYFRKVVYLITKLVPPMPVFAEK